MTTQANIPGSNLLPNASGLHQTAALLACLLYADPMNILADWYRCYRGFIPVQYQSHTSPPLTTTDPEWTWQQVLHRFAPPHTDLTSWVDQLFYSSKNQVKMAKKIPANGVTAEKVQNDAVFERTRENMAEFTRAGKASVSIRELFRELTVYAKSNDAHTRLVKVLSKVIATDPVSKRGERTVANGDLLLLKGFNFNRRVPLREILYPRYTVTIDRVTGQAILAMPEFVPKTLIACPKGTTHFKMVAALATINFETDESTYVKTSTDEIAWGQVPVAAANMALNFPANTPNNVILVVSLEFYQHVNGVSYDLKTGQSNAAAIVAVSQP